MKEEVAKRLYNSAKRLGYTGRDGCVRVNKTYSGRGMFGKTTFALSMPGINYLAALAAGTRMKQAERNDFAEELRNIRTDSMGLGIVVY